MHKKILAICAALVALGVLAIAPAMASAATLYDTEGGLTVKVAAGKGIIADSTGISKFSGGGLTVECDENVMTGTIHKNDGNEIQGTIEDAWFQSKLNASGTLCKSTSGPTTITIPGLTNGSVKNTHWCIRTVPGTDNWELWGNNCTTEPGSGALTFVLHNSLGTCYYTRSAAVTGTFNTSPAHEGLVLTMSGEPEFKTEAGTSHGVLCPATGKLSNFVFDLYTDTIATPATPPHIFGAQPTADPLFVTNP